MSMCAGKRAKERDSERMCVCVCVCVCERERERERACASRMTERGKKERKRLDTLKNVN